MYINHIYIYIYKFESLDKPGIGDGYNHPSQLFAREEFHTFPGNVCLLVLAEKVLAIDDNSFEVRGAQHMFPVQIPAQCVGKGRVQSNANTGLLYTLTSRNSQSEGRSILFVLTCLRFT